MEPRIAKLRSRILSSPNTLCIERAKYYTEYMKSNEARGEPIIVRQAKALSHVLQNMSIHIFPQELIVGTIVSKPPGAIFYPELLGTLVMPEISDISTRAVNPLKISASDINVLMKEITPYWKGKTILDRARTYFSRELVRVSATLAPFILTEAAGISHTTINYPYLINKGFNGIETRIAAKGESAFYDACKIVCNALSQFSNRYAKLAEKQALEVHDNTRAEELKRIAKICKHVPAYPPREFHEALQFIWFTQLALHQESYEQGISIGRLDQILYRFFVRDFERYGQERIKELLQCLWLKTCEIIPCLPLNIATNYFGGLLTNQAVTIGGVNSEGEDVTNELSYLILDATDELAVRQPNLIVRLHEKTPVRFKKKVAKLISRGKNVFAVVNDEVVIKALMRRGVTLRDARDYAITGCVELTSAGRTFSSSDAALFSLPFCLELALSNGKGSRQLRRVEIPFKLNFILKFLFKLWVRYGRIGVKTGKPSEFKTINDVISAFKKQVAYFVKLMVEGSNALERAHLELKPTPLLSICIDNCIARGMDVTQGGAKYNFTGVQAVGIADVADSLAAIEHVVFNTRQIDMNTLLRALKHNFNTEEPLRLTLWNKAPKYGNDVDDVDAYAEHVAEIYEAEVTKYTNPRGGQFIPGVYSIGTQVGFGRLVGALPSGRRAGEPFATGINPHQGCDLNGPTATMRSVTKLDHGRFANGVAFNLKLNPSWVRTTKGKKALAALIDAYFKIGGMHVHFNIIDKRTLLAAQKHPERYTDLLIRLGGFSARFIDLSKAHQDELISRTEHYGK